MGTIDFNALASALRILLPSILDEWLPGGKIEGRNYVVRNPTRDDHEPSLKILVNSGQWKDFATDDGGGDLISLWAYLHRIGQAEAARELAQQHGLLQYVDEEERKQYEPKAPKPTGRPAVEKPDKKPRHEWKPVGVDASTIEPPNEHPTFGKFYGQWRYVWPDGSFAGYVFRCDPPGTRKQYPALLWCESPAGKRAWRWQGLPLWPLYNVVNLLAKPDATVILTEGEKAADAAGRLFPDWVAVTSQGGSKAIKKTQWGDLAGRRVIIWPDNDPAGLEYARNVATILEGLGCTVARVSIDQQWVDKFDAADFEALAMDPAPLRAALESGAGTMPAKAPLSSEQGFACPWPAGSEPWPVYASVEFALTRDGVIRHTGQNIETISHRPMWVDAITLNLQGHSGMLVKFFNRRWELKEYAFPMGRLNEQGGILGQELQTQDFPVSPGKEKWLCRYLNQQSIQIAKYKRSVGRVGWVDSAAVGLFVMPSGVIGNPDVPIVYQADVMHLSETLTYRGTLDDWKANIAGPLRGNPMLQFGVMSAFAGALLRPCSVEMGGWHFYGVTSGGKTTLLQCAASVWGNSSDPQMGPEDTTIRKWASTAAGFESMAEAHNDSCLCIDELEQAPKDELGKIIFLLAGGLSKSRSTVAGGLRPNKTWRIMILSSGEKSIRHQMSMQGDAYKGGKAVRIVDIPVDGSDGERSIFAECGDMAPELWGHRLKAHMGLYYGTAGPFFVRKIVEESEKLGWVKLCEQMRELLISARDALGAKRTDIPPEGKRVLMRFALCLVAGWYAGEWGIVDWTRDEMLAAVRGAVTRWLDNQGDERSEQDKALAHLRDAIIANEGRIVRLELREEKRVVGREVIDSAVMVRDGKPMASGRGIIGFVSGEAFGFTASGFRELCGEFDLRMVVNTLRMRRFLVCESKDRHTYKWPTIGEYRRQYLYTVRLQFMGDGDEGNPTPF